ncbi:MAG: oligosaccharide flippase family protein [Pseudomonadota bacterium]
MTSDVNAETPVAAAGKAGAARSLKRRTVVGGAWSMVGFGVTRALRLISNLILVQYLAPEAFGLMSIAVSLSFGLSMMSDIGIKASVIREKEGETQAFINVAWSVQVLRNALIASALMLGAILLKLLGDAGALSSASVYADEKLPMLLAFVAGTVVIDGFVSMAPAVCARRMDYARIVTLEIIARLCAVVVTILFAINGFDIWSLAFGTLTNSVVMLVGAHLLGASPTAFSLERARRRKIINYGKWLLLASPFGYIVAEGDIIIFGALVEKSEFGVYAVAAIWARALRSVISVIMSKVAYPVFAEINRERPDAATRIYNKLRDLADLGTVAAYAALFVLVEPVLGLFYSGDYSNVGFYVKLTALTILLTPYDFLNSILLSGGDSKKYAFSIAASVIAMLSLTPLIYRIAGFESAIVFAACVKVFSVPLTWWFASKRVALSPIREGRMMAALALGVAACLVLN